MDILAGYKTDRNTCHCAAINGHLSFSKIFPCSVMERQLLAQKGIYTVSQIMEVDKFTARMSTDESRALLADLAPFSLLQHKL
jgi:hypothetical protein